MKKVILAQSLLMVLLAGVSIAQGANYVKPAEFKQWLESKKPLVIVDIQPAEDYVDQHFKGSIETNAFPAKTDEEKKLLDKALPAIQQSKGSVVVVCPRGKTGASNAYEYLKQRGVPENRLFILENGIDGWPYKELFVKGR